MAKKDFTTPLTLNGDYPNLDDRYTNNGDPYTSVSAAQTVLASKINAYHIGLTVLVKESGWTEAKEYWVQPYDDGGNTLYHFVEKQQGGSVPSGGGVTIGDGENPALELAGTVEVEARTAAGTNPGVEITPRAGGGVSMKFSLPKGADGADGAPGADAVNPFKGYYPTGVSKPATGAVGDYLYAPPSDSQSTSTATIWHYDSTQTPPWTDTGIDVSAVVGVEFGSGQAVIATKIKDENGEEVTGTADVLSAEAGQNLFGIATKGYNLYDGSIGDDGVPVTTGTGVSYKHTSMLPVVEGMYSVICNDTNGVKKVCYYNAPTFSSDAFVSKNNLTDAVPANGKYASFLFKNTNDSIEFNYDTLEIVKTSDLSNIFNDGYFTIDYGFYKKLDGNVFNNFATLMKYKVMDFHLYGSSVQINGTYKFRFNSLGSGTLVCLLKDGSGNTLISTTNGVINVDSETGIAEGTITESGYSIKLSVDLNGISDFSHGQNNWDMILTPRAFLPIKEEGATDLTELTERVESLEESNDDLNSTLEGVKHITDVSFDISTERTENLFDYTARSIGEVLKTSPTIDGTTVSNSNYDTSDFIPIVKGSNYRTSANARYVMFYDESKNYIQDSAITSSTTTISKNSIPEGAKYIRLSISHSYLTDKYMLVKGNVQPNENNFIPYEIEKCNLKPVVLPVPKIKVPDVIYSHVGDKLQLFWRSIIDTNDLEDYSITATVSGISVRDNNSRYLLIEPSSSETGNKTITIYVHDNFGNIVAQKTITLVVNNVPSSPNSNKNILCVGASVIAKGYIALELNRRLTEKSGIAEIPLSSVTGISEGTELEYRGSTPYIKLKVLNITGKTVRVFSSNIKDLPIPESTDPSIDLYYDDTSTTTYRVINPTAFCPTGLGLNNISFVGRKEGEYANIYQEATGGRKIYDYVSAPEKICFFHCDSSVDSIDRGYKFSNNNIEFTVTETNKSENTLRCSYDSSSEPEASGTLTPVGHSITITYNSVVRETSNPFWDGNEERIDFNTYCSANSVPSIDYLVLFMGMNDIYGGRVIEDPTGVNTDTIKNSIIAFITQFHEDFPTGKVMLCELYLTSFYGGYGIANDVSYFANRKKQVFEFNKMVQDIANDDNYKDYVIFCPVTSQFDCEYGYTLKQFDVNNRINDYKDVFAIDELHPRAPYVVTTNPSYDNTINTSPNGYYMFADAMYRCFVNELNNL